MFIFIDGAYQYCLRLIRGIFQQIFFLSSWHVPWFLQIWWYNLSFLASESRKKFSNPYFRLYSSDTMPIRRLNQNTAQQLDVDLMSKYNFTLDQLMELAGLSVSCSILEACQGKNLVDKCNTETNSISLLVCCGPGNNGGDGLVAARHLKHFGFDPSIVYPKKLQRLEHLLKQCENLDIPVLEDVDFSKPDAMDRFDLVLDGVFGFSFKGAPRPPFEDLIRCLSTTKTPVCSIDIPRAGMLKRVMFSTLGFILKC